MPVGETLSQSKLALEEVILSTSKEVNEGTLIIVKVKLSEVTVQPSEVPTTT